MRLVLRLAIPSVIAGLTLVACASTSPAAATAAPASAAPAAKAALTIKGFAFSPAALEVTKGTQITIANNDSTTHTFTTGANRTKDGKIDQQISGGTETTITLDTPGTYDYFCNIHASMKGTITVK